MDWQPIATAPKNGEMVDLWIGGRMRMPDCCWKVPSNPKHDWPKGKTAWCYYHDAWAEWVELSDEPTHWMLVEPPK